MRENEVARSAAMQWFGIRGRAHGQPQTLTGNDLSSLIASVVHACNEAREAEHVTTETGETKVDVHVDVNIAEAVDRAVERQFMTDEAIARYQTELAAVRKNLTDAHKELAESNVRIGAVTRKCDELNAHRDQLLKANASLHERISELKARADLNFDAVGVTERSARRASEAFCFVQTCASEALRALSSVHHLPGGPVEIAKTELERALKVKL